MNSKYSVYDEVYVFNEEREQVVKGRIRAIYKDAIDELYDVDIDVGKGYSNSYFIKKVSKDFVKLELDKLKGNIEKYYLNKIADIECCIKQIKELKL